MSQDNNGTGNNDRTNGFEDGRDYMRVKKTKLAAQNDKIRESLRSRNSAHRTDIFKGVSINVNGRTQPTADELKRLILLNGGDYHPYYRYQTTKFMIATNLSTARIKTLRPDDRIVRPDWITESVQAKCLLPYQDYQLFADEPRGEKGLQAVSATGSQSPGKKRQSRQNARDRKELDDPHQLQLSFLPASSKANDTTTFLQSRKSSQSSKSLSEVPVPSKRSWCSSKLAPVGQHR